MKKLKAWAQRALGLCLTALLIVPVLAAEPLTAKQRQVMLLYYAEGKNMREPTPTPSPTRRRANS